MQQACEICHVPAQEHSTTRDEVHRICPRCGEFKISGTAVALTKSLSDDQRAIISGWIREQNIVGTVPEIDSRNLNRLLLLPRPNFTDRVNRFLLYVIRNQRKLGQSSSLDDPALISVTYSFLHDDVAYIAYYLKNQGLIQIFNQEFQITGDGYRRFEEIQGRKAISSQVFVAMWFHLSMNDAYTSGFDPGIRNAGYEPLRIDRHEHTARIDDEIIAQSVNHGSSSLISQISVAESTLKLDLHSDSVCRSSGRAVKITSTASILTFVSSI